MEAITASLRVCVKRGEYGYSKADCKVVTFELSQPVSMKVRAGEWYSHKIPTNSRQTDLNMNIRILTVTHCRSCYICPVTMKLSWIIMELNASRVHISPCVVLIYKLEKRYQPLCWPVCSRTLTGLVELLGRLSSPLQPGGIEVAPFVLGFISTATGASGRRRCWWWWRLGRETGRHLRLTLV